MSDLIGQTIGNYRVESLMGTGGMGQVYRGVHVHLNRTVAIKVMHEHLARDASFRARFLREANAAAKLNHPNIVKVQDFGEQQGLAYLVMELATGGSLRALLQRQTSAGQPLPWPAGIPLVLQAAQGLDYAHSQGMVHRDVKPDNLLLQPLEGTAAVMAPPEAPFSIKICDFGVAQLRSDARLTATGVAIGTPAYISPEQCQGLDLDGRSDIYSLGIILYEIATGYLPFETKSMAEALYKHVNTPPPPPRGVRSDLPADLEAAILRCLAKRPEDRYATAGQLADALRMVLASVTPPPAPSAERVAAAGARSVPLDATLIPMVPGGSPAPAAIVRPQVVLLDRDGQPEHTLDLPDGGMVIGRAKDADVVLDDPKVSRHHLRINWDGRQATVTDLDSGNGTWLGGARLLPNAPQPWPAGAALVVGPFGLRLDAPAGGSVPSLRPAPTGAEQRAPAGAPVAAGPAPLPAAPPAPPPSLVVAPPAAPPAAPPPLAPVPLGSTNGPPVAPAAEPDGRGYQPVPPHSNIRFVRSEEAGAPVAAGPVRAATGPARPQVLLAQKQGQLRPVAPLTEHGVTVGREQDNLVVLPDHQVSRHHLRIDWDGTRATVVDLGSGNGTWLNNVRLTPHVPQPWPPDAELKIGPYLLRQDLTGAYGVTGDGRAGDADLDVPSRGAVAPGAAGAGAAVSVPRLVALDESGQPLQGIDLAEGVISVGRAKDNQMVLDDGKRKVSRRHLQIAWDGRQATVTDLGSDNGTSLGEAKLPPNAPQPWPAEEWLRLGPFWLRLELPSLPVRAEAGSGLLTAVGRVQMLLEQRTLTITPGQPAMARGTVANIGNIVDHFHVTVEGVPKPWVAGDALRSADNEKMQLNPGAQAPVALTITPPRVPESRAGDYVVNVLAHSTQSETELGVAQAVWTVLPFTGSSLALERGRAAARRRGKYRAIIENKGNAPARFALSATDEDQALRYHFADDALTLEPGQRATVPLTVEGPTYWMGIPRSRLFRVQLAPEEGDAPPPVMAEFVQSPLIPQWVPRVVAGVIPFLFVAALLLQSFLIGWLRPNIQDFRAAPSNAVEGQPVTLNWNVQRAQRIQIDGLDAVNAANATPSPGGAPPGTPQPTAQPTPLPPQGQQTLGQGLTKDQEFKLKASNLFGPVEASVKVAVATFTATATVPPTATPLPTATVAPTDIPAPVVEAFTVTPVTINLGEAVRITWQVSNADSVTISGLADGPVTGLPLQGDLSDRPDRTVTYRLTTSNKGKAGPVKEAVVTVRATPTAVPPTATRPPASG